MLRRLDALTGFSGATRVDDPSAEEDANPKAVVHRGTSAGSKLGQEP